MSNYYYESNSNVTPLTINQILNVDFSKNNKYKVDNVETKTISVVCKILDIDIQQTNVDFFVSDEMKFQETELTTIAEKNKTFLTTKNQMHARLYTSPENENLIKTIHKNDYYKIIGVIRAIGGETFVLIFTMQPLVEYTTQEQVQTIQRQIEVHRLDSLNTHLFNTIGKFKNGGQTTAVNNNNMVIDNNNNINNEVLSMIKTIGKNKEDGAEISEDIIKKLKDKYSKVEIEKAVKYLDGEGLIYSTTTDHHYRCTIE